VKVPFKVVKYKLVPYTAYKNVSYEVTEYQLRTSVLWAHFEG